MLGDLALLGERFVGGLFSGDDFAELGHGDLGEIAACVSSSELAPLAVANFGPTGWPPVIAKFRANRGRPA